MTNLIRTFENFCLFLLNFCQKFVMLFCQIVLIFFPNFFLSFLPNVVKLFFQTFAKIEKAFGKTFETKLHEKFDKVRRNVYLVTKVFCQTNCFAKKFSQTQSKCWSNLTNCLFYNVSPNFTKRSFVKNCLFCQTVLKISVKMMVKLFVWHTGKSLTNVFLKQFAKCFAKLF